MRDRFLKRYAAWVVRNSLGIVIGASLLGVASLILSLLFLKTQTGILDLYSESEPVAKRFMEFTDQFGASETLVIAVEGGQETDRRQALDLLAHRLQKGSNDFIEDLLYKIDLGLFENHAFQFLSETEAQKLLQEIESPRGGVRLFFQAHDINQYLEFLNDSLREGLAKPKAPPPNASQQFAQGLGPLYLLRDFLQGQDLSPEAMVHRLQGNSNEHATLDDQGYLRTDDGSMHLMMIRPLDRKQDYRIAQKMVESVRSQIQPIKAQFPQLKIGVTGGPALNNDQFKISERDMTWASVFAFCSTGIIFFLAFRSFVRPLLGLLTLAISISCAFGLTTLTVGYLNLFSLAFIVILVGQGTYYGVHVVARYEEELLKGESVSNALQNTIFHIFGNITTSTLTTACAFFATLLVPLKGFAELGWIAGSGILVSSMGMQMVLPALLNLRDRHRPQNRLMPPHKELLGKSFHQRWIHAAPRLLQRSAPALIVIVTVLSTWGAYLFFSPKHGIPFDSNLLNLQAKGTEAVEYEKKLVETSLSPRAGIFLAKTHDEARRIAEAAAQLPTVQRVEWLGNLLPQTNVQTSTQEKISQAILELSPAPLKSPDSAAFNRNLRELQKQLTQLSEKALQYGGSESLLNETEKALIAVQEILDKDPEQISHKDDASKKILANSFFVPQLLEFQNRFFPQIRKMFLNSAQATNLTLDGLPKELHSRFLSAEGTYAIYAFPSVNIWEKQPLDTFVSQLISIDKGVTGPPIMFHEILGLVRTSYFQAAAFSAIAIFLLFLINFRSLKYSLLASLPLAMGTLSLFGLMSSLDLSFNMANMIALPMILGIGADNGVHIIERFREENEMNLDFLFGSTGKALLITYLDTMTSFVGLAFANHQGLAQLGRVVILGISCCTFMGILLLPAIMTFIIQRKKRQVVFQESTALS